MINPGKPVRFSISGLDLDNAGGPQDARLASPLRALQGL